MDKHYLDHSKSSNKLVYRYTQLLPTHILQYAHLTIQETNLIQLPLKQKLGMKGGFLFFL